MVDMFFPRLDIELDIIEIGHCEFIRIVMKHDFHNIHENCRNICLTKWDNNELKMTIMGPKTALEMSSLVMRILRYLLCMSFTEKY